MDNRYYFVCIDIVGASKNVKEQENNLKILLNFIARFLKENNLDSKKNTTFTGDGIFIVFSNNDILPLKLAIELHYEFRSQYNSNSDSTSSSAYPNLDFQFKIGISYGEASVIREAEILNGLPYWGEASTIAKRLCDLCDSYHILINDKAERQFRNLINSNPDFLPKGQDYEDIFQDIGKYYVKHKQELEVFNFYFKKENNIVGNLSLPLDKRGIIDRLPINEKLARPLDFFFEKEAFKIVNKIDNEEGLILFIDSAKKLYEALFEDVTDYYGINKTIPSQFFKFNQQFLIRHAELVRSNNGKEKPGIRIMLMTKEDIRRDWYHNTTRTANTNFIRFHMDHNIKLLQINPYTVQETIIPNLLTKYRSFYIQSSHIGIWKDRYVVLFGKLDLTNSSSSVGDSSTSNISASKLGIGKFWIFSLHNPIYKYCEGFFNELLNYQKYEINELALDEQNKPVFIKWTGEKGYKK